MAQSSKRDLIVECLDRGLIMIHVHARSPGVRVPPAFRDQSHLRLNLSYDFPEANVFVEDDWITASLSFSGQRFPCRIPLEAVFGVTSFERGALYLFAGDVPPEVRDAWERILEEDIVESLPPSDTGPHEQPIPLHVVGEERPKENAEDGAKGFVKRAAKKEEAAGGDVDGAGPEDRGEHGEQPLPPEPPQETAPAQQDASLPHAPPSLRVIDGGRSLPEE